MILVPRVLLQLRRTWAGRRPVTLHQVGRLVEEVCRVLTGRRARPIAGAGPKPYSVGTWDPTVGARALRVKGGTSHWRRRGHAGHR